MKKGQRKFYHFSKAELDLLLSWWDELPFKNRVNAKYAGSNQLYKKIEQFLLSIKK